ncbi:MAG: methyl-accepting chemotaxis protein, partial [Proteobacteria bacterium]
MIMFKKLSFKMKLMGILSVMSVSTIGLFVYQAKRTNDAFRTAKESHLRGTVEGLLEKIDRNLFERYGDVQAYALSEPARSLDPTRITAFINDMMATYAPVYDLMIVTDVKGKVIAASSVGKNGKPIDVKPLMGADYSAKPWFKASVSDRVAAGSSFVEDMQLDEEVASLTGSPGKVMNFSSPIRDRETGRIIGVWSNRMSWADVVESIIKEETAKIKNDQITVVAASIVDSKGMYLFHPKGSEFELKRTHDQFHPADAGADQLPIREIADGMIEAGVVSHGYSTYPGRGWGAVVSIPAEDKASLERAQFLMLACAVIIAANILAWIVIFRTSLSVERMVARLFADSAQIKTSATNVSDASQRLSSSTTEQAAAIAETATSMEEMTAMLVAVSAMAAACSVVDE